MASSLDRFVAVSFLCFLGVEYALSEEEWVWAVRGTWLAVALSGAWFLRGSSLQEEEEEVLQVTTVSTTHTQRTETALAEDKKLVEEVVVEQSTTTVSVEPASQVSAAPSVSSRSSSRSLLQRTRKTLSKLNPRKKNKNKKKGEALNDTMEWSDLNSTVEPSVNESTTAEPAVAPAAGDQAELEAYNQQLAKLGFGPEAPRPPPDFEYVRPEEENWGYSGHLEVEQQSSLDTVRGKTWTCKEAQLSPPAVVIDDEFLLRFLRARKFDVGKTEKLMQAHLDWRDKFMPTQITPNDVSEVLGSGLARFGPYSKQGLPTVMVKVSFFEPKLFPNVDMFTRYAAFFFERGVGKLPKGADKACLFFDMQGWSLFKHGTPYGLKLTLELLTIIQNHNVERLSLCILFNTPAVFGSTWRIIKKLLDPVVANKIHFVYDKSNVLEWFNQDTLPEEYGGLRKEPYPIEGYLELHSAPQETAGE